MKAVPVAGESSDTSKSAQGSTAEAVETSTPEPAPPEAAPAAAEQAAVPAPASEREPEPDPRAEAAPPVREPADDPARPEAEKPTGTGTRSESGTERAAGAPTPVTTDPPTTARPEAPAKPSAEASAKPSGDAPAEGSAAGSAEGSGEAPAEGSAAGSAEGSAAGSAKGSSEEPAKEPAEVSPEGSAAASTKASAKEPAEASTEVPAKAPAKASTEPSAKPSSDAPAEASAAGSAKPSAEAPAKASAKAPAKASTEDSSRSGDEESTGTGDGESTGSGSGRAAVPESDNERTSTFVALKPLESTGAPAKAPAAPAPTTPSWAKGATPAKAPATAERPAPPARTPAPAPTAAAPAPAPAPAPAARPTAPEPPQAVPPLDLLAQLTNTPPPQETTARTLGRRVKIWTPVLLGLVGAAVVAQMVRPLPAPTVASGDAAASFTFDGTYTPPWPSAGQGAMRVVGSGEIGSFGEQKPVPIASVAKVMTAYVVLTGHPLKKGEAGPQIEIDAKMVADGTSADESRVEGLTAGTKYSQQDVLKMLMIPSGNNAARLLARWDGGGDSEAAFVEKMNAAAKELGMTNTTYTDPSGLDAGTKSTAEDQLKLAEAVMRFDAFRAIVSMPSAPIQGLPKPLINNNGNLLLANLSVAGIKTGSSSAAGGALMWAAYKSVGGKDQLIVGATLEQRAPAPDKDALDSLDLVKANSKKIIESVRSALTAAGAVKKGQVVGYVDDKLGKRTPLVATRDGQVAGVPGQKVRFKLTDGGKALPHEAKAGTQVGELVLGDGPGAATIPLALKEDLVEPSFGAKVLRLG
ncbi:serine hydrolase [Streptomyces sp. NPDC059917]|uniref:serine hydrolase n=1 Tax=Streptomyces sp. NPDC059917 TaxID=3347002 RepID=UPI0036568164